MRYAEDFLSAEEEAALLTHIAALPLAHAEYLQYTARRRIVSYGGRYDFAHKHMLPGPPIPRGCSR